MVRKYRGDHGDKSRGGSFTDVTDSLPSLFSDPDGRGAQSWQEMFGFIRRPPRKPDDLFFSAPEAPKSSSGS